MVSMNPSDGSHSGCELELPKLAFGIPERSSDDPSKDLDVPDRSLTSTALCGPLCLDILGLSLILAHTFSTQLKLHNT
jgi:hypothetical protein